MRAPLVVVGDSLLDRDVDGTVSRICPDSPCPVLDQTSASARPGGAALAAAIAAAMAGTEQRRTVLLSRIGDDPAGLTLRNLLVEAGVEVVELGPAGATPEKIRLRAGAHTLLRLDRGSTTDAPPTGVPSAARAVLSEAAAVLVSDYGRAVTSSEPLRRVLTGTGRPVVWDPHPRGSEPVPGCLIVTPNRSELPSGPPGATGPSRDHQPGPSPLAAVTASAAAARRRWAAGGVAVTMGAAGALYVTGDGAPLIVPAPAVAAADTCGAGDCFAARAALSVAEGALPSEAVTAAVRASARFVERGAAARYPDSVSSAAAAGGGADGPPAAPAAVPLARTVRASGGSLVAAGGCFDVLHAGHVSLLSAARALGDRLVVCVNSDASVRRLKGPGRPVNPQGDRAATLLALGCVDAVEVFEEDTPEAVLRRLQPHVWVKGGDYDARRLPEAQTLAEWGGQAVVLPYLVGRSTTGILERAWAGGR